MIRFLHRFLASLDRFIHESFKMTRDGGHSSEGTSWYYWKGWGRRCLIVGPDNKVRYLGYSFAVRHRYDKSGSLLDRTRMPKWANPEDHVFYGYQADQVYDRLAPKLPSTGGFEN